MCRIIVVPMRDKPKKSLSRNEQVDYIRAMPLRNTTYHHMMASEPQSAPLPSGVYINHASAALSSSPPPHGNSVAKNFVDHYAILNLDCWATSEEIKASYRALRTQYFSSNPLRYRALQAAFDTLVDRQARVAYDQVYRMRMGLPPPRDVMPAPHPSRNSGSDEKALPVHVETKREPNDALKMFVWGRYHVLIGSRPYQSWIPMREGYRGREMHPVLLCQRPKYVLLKARNARSA
ncbi:hypothetical protein P154DRAFT_354559 [Amniculicola lignicola CBS 123094]|uniref:J domain-containing protein n=1 Tax=Amniculicola lignicola CBS 123094 TaxID=1392246 RepID=A0A6A5WU27_9PLEO|nr:hypothetical protein P154DRAFT_354559 [Amniculicola lignicola CBS 123094]